MLTLKEIVAELVSEYGSLEAAMLDGETDGICRNCGNIQSGVEPDARMYRCENCGEDKVYGLEETIITLV
jgi:hypothetical protein